jgi:hypothetical protein
LPAFLHHGICNDAPEKQAFFLFEQNLTCRAEGASPVRQNLTCQPNLTGQTERIQAGISDVRA